MELTRLQISGYIVALGSLLALSGHCLQSTDPVAGARSLLNAGELAKSEAELRNYLKGEPASADAHFLLGYVLFREERAKDSLAEFTAGAKDRRPGADELKVVASDYVMLGDFGDADKWFTQVVTEKPDDADAWYLLGRTKFNESDFAAAKSSLERALALRPKYVEAENNIGLSWQELNDAEKAKAAFQTAIEWQGTSPADAQPFLNLATLLLDGNEADKAVAYLTRAESIAGNNPKVHEELGRAYLAQHSLSQAATEFEKAIALSPDTSALHFKLGQIYRKEGMIDRAQREFDICAKLNSAHSSIATPNPPAPGGSTPK